MWFDLPDHWQTFAAVVLTVGAAFIAGVFAMGAAFIAVRAARQQERREAPTPNVKRRLKRWANRAGLRTVATAFANQDTSYQTWRC
jgi:hypothetical protein